MRTHTHTDIIVNRFVCLHTFINATVNVSMRRHCNVAQHLHCRRFGVDFPSPTSLHQSSCSSGALRAAEFVKFMLFAVAACIICVFAFKCVFVCVCMHMSVCVSFSLSLARHDYELLYIPFSLAKNLKLCMYLCLHYMRIRTQNNPK